MRRNRAQWRETREILGETTVSLVRRFALMLKLGSLDSIIKSIGSVYYVSRRYIVQQ